MVQFGKLPSSGGGEPPVIIPGDYFSVGGNGDFNRVINWVMQQLKLNFSDEITQQEIEGDCRNNEKCAIKPSILSQIQSA